jgi:hypothetical protein
MKDDLQHHTLVASALRVNRPPPPGSLSSCCDALEPRVKVDPRNGQPRSDQANVKALCNSYKKQQPQQQQADTNKPAPGRKYWTFKGQGELR